MDGTDRKNGGFETPNSTRKERKLRIERLEAFGECEGHALENRAHARELAAAMRVLPDNAHLNSPADPSFMREFRLRFCGEALRLTQILGSEQAGMYFLVSPRWRVKGDKLRQFKPRTMLESLRVEMNRFGGSAGLNGGALLASDNEYDPFFDDYQPHIHSIVYGEMRKAIEALRELPMFDPKLDDRVRRPVECHQIRDPALQISYLLKPFTQSRDRTATRRGEKTIRAREHRIPEPRHSEMLLAIDKYDINDLVGRVGLRVSGGRLKPTRDWR